MTEFFNINVLSVMGITDIDDKIINRARGSSRFSDWRELSRFYEQEFHKEMKMLNINPPYLHCRVTDYVPEIIDFIKMIMSKDMAYVSNGSVYFKTLDHRIYDKFGKLDNAARVKTDGSEAEKGSILDFALWKARKLDDEPSWESPWGQGRPGWHIECSTMASLTLGNSIDIHSGGLDLMFPHHENEEAQSCCHHEKDQWINYWLHSGLLHLNDIKMSKSLNNTITIKELLEQYTANQFRLLCLHTHYRSPIEFSHESMQKAISLLKKFEYFQSDCKNYLAGKFQCGMIDEGVIYDKLVKARKNIHEALANDFGTPRVIEELSELVGTVHKMLDPQVNETASAAARSADCVAAVSEYVFKVLKALGIGNNHEANEDDGKINQVVDTLVDFRDLVRNKSLDNLKQGGGDKKLLTACDDVRKNLAACGIKIKAR